MELLSERESKSYIGISLGKGAIEQIKNAFNNFDRLPNYEKNTRDIFDLAHSKGQITDEGIIFESYINGDGDSIFGMACQLILDGSSVYNIYHVDFTDPLVVEENYALRILKGLNDKIYVLEADFYEYKGKKYIIFPNYILKFDGSIEPVKGSSHENFIKLRGIKEYNK